MHGSSITAYTPSHSFSYGLDALQLHKFPPDGDGASQYLNLRLMPILPAVSFRQTSLHSENGSSRHSPFTKDANILVLFLHKYFRAF